MQRVFFLIFVVLFSKIYAQNVPWSFYHQSELKNAEVFELKEFDRQLLLEQDKYNTFIKSYSFAKAFDVDLYLDDGVKINDTETVAIKKIIATGANGISLILSTDAKYFRGEFFVFDSNFRHIIQHKFTNKQQVFSTAFLPNDTVFIEYHFYNNFDAVQIKTIGAAYRDITDESEWCEVNVNCDTNEIWQTVKHSIVRILFKSDNKSYYYCTGNLIANTTLDKTPYLITANHCIKTESEAESAIFYFNYEAAACDSTSGDETETVSGASLVATADNLLDFSLLKLSVTPPKDFLPYYSGWDLTHSYSDTSVCIHHPSGDIKKISYNFSPLDVSSFSGYSSNKHWWVHHWDSGTTEGGSSGSGLFTQQGLLIGTLSGGDANCNSNNDDYFQQFYHCWDDYYSYNKQLRHWLNPFGFKIDKMQGYYPYLNDNLSRPKNLIVSQNDSLVFVSWQAADNNPDKYFLYRNLVKIAEFTEPSAYTDFLTDADVYTYYVTAVWGQNESKPSNMESIVYGDTSRLPKVTYIKVFPNPTTGRLNISTPDSNAIKKVDVIDIYGRTVLTRQFKQETNINVKLTGLKPSCYILKLTTIGDVYYKKIVYVD